MACRGHLPRGSEDDDVAAAPQGGRARLFDHHLADAEQARHHRDAEPEAAGQNRAPRGACEQRSQREPEDHRS